MESWFGRPKAKGNNYSTGTLSGRPTSTDGEVAFDIQELEKTIRALSDSEVDAKFMEILEDMNIPKDKRGPLLSKSITERQKMIFMHLKGKLNRKKFIFYHIFINIADVSVHFVVISHSIDKIMRIQQKKFRHFAETETSVSFLLILLALKEKCVIEKKIV